MDSSSDSEVPRASDPGSVGHPEKSSANRRADHARLGLVAGEVDRLLDDMRSRTSSIANKASFLAVSAGVVVTASTAQVWSKLVWFGVAALSLACIGLVCAAIALRPERRFGIIAQRLTDKYLDSPKSCSVIERQLTITKADSITRHEEGLRSRSAWVWRGFISLALSAASLTIVFTAELIG